MEQKISFITFAVKDFDKELAFYRDCLGWNPFTEIDNTIAFFNTGSLVFALCAVEELEADAGVTFETKPPLGVTISQNVSNVHAVDDIFAKIKQCGGKIIREPELVSWGGYRGYFADPEGHLWEIAYNPQFKFDHNGNMVIPP